MNTPTPIYMVDKNQIICEDAMGHHSALKELRHSMKGFMTHILETIDE
jgi:hypothetical protein